MFTVALVQSAHVMGDKAEKCEGEIKERESELLEKKSCSQKQTVEKAL